MLSGSRSNVNISTVGIISLKIFILVIFIMLYFGGDRMHRILNGEPLEEVDCFEYLGLQVAADGGCERDVVKRNE